MKMRRGNFIILILAGRYLLFAGLTAVAGGDDLLADLEKQVGGRIGVVAVETGTEQRLAHRDRERFAMCSTFKLLLAAHVLHRVDVGQERLERLVRYGSADLLSYAPVTAKHLPGMTVGDLCAAALQTSDNTAANLLLRSQGGPQGLTEYARSLGDKTTHLDRTEPALNTPVPGKDLDSTTPAAMAETLRRLLLGTALSPASREQLARWLRGNQTGGARLKAGLPATWSVADKTGTGDNGAVSDIGILYPPTGSPIVIAAYLSGSQAPTPKLEAALAETARLVARKLGAAPSKR
jgi:beta-lactamase class A